MKFSVEKIQDGDAIESKYFERVCHGMFLDKASLSRISDFGDSISLRLEPDFDVLFGSNLWASSLEMDRTC